MDQLKTEERIPYVTEREREADDKVLEHAKAILHKRLCKKMDIMVTSREEALAYLKVRVGGLEHEAFGVMFLGIRGEMLGIEEMFRGSLVNVAVYPREIAKAALHYNAAAVVLYHNHPTADSTPSQPDIETTKIVDRALKAVGVVLVDHIVVAGNNATSMEEKGLMPRSHPSMREVPPQILELLRLMGGGPVEFDT